MGLHGKVGGSFQEITEGLHPARCVAVYDLGTQNNPKFNKSEHKVLIQWELMDEDREFEGEHYKSRVSRIFTLSMNPKANLRRIVDSWRGKKMTDEEAEAFDLFTLAGKPCMVQTSNTKKGEKTYTNVDAIVCPPRGTEIAPAMGQVQTYAMGDALPERLPEWIMVMITSAPEFTATEPPPAEATGDNVPF